MNGTGNGLYHASKCFDHSCSSENKDFSKKVGASDGAVGVPGPLVQSLWYWVAVGAAWIIFRVLLCEAYP